MVLFLRNPVYHMNEVQVACVDVYANFFFRFTDSCLYRRLFAIYMS